MKKLMATAFLVILANEVSLHIATANVTNNFQDIIVQAKSTKDVKPIISALPDAEKVWSQQPEQYFKFMREAAYILSAVSPTNDEAYQAELFIFTNTLSKPFPLDAFSTNNSMAAACFNLQYHTSWTCLYVVEDSGQKPTLMLLAQFLGQVRSHVIPNYKSKVFLNPPGAMDRSPEKVREAIEENGKNATVADLQRTLRDANKILTFELLHGCAHFPSSNPANTDFIQQISDAAHLTDVERKKL